MPRAQAARDSLLAAYHMGLSDIGLSLYDVAEANEVWYHRKEKTKKEKSFHLLILIMASNLGHWEDKRMAR